MVTAAGVSKGDTVLEIGPGFGLLTEKLLARGARVIAIELDQRLYEYLVKKFRGQPQLELIRGDYFRTNLNNYLKDEDFQVVASLPYSGTGLFFRNFMTTKPRPKKVTVLVQKEVAERIDAAPGKMNMLGVMVQLYAKSKYVATVDRMNFYPVPAVTSAVIHLARRPQVDETSAAQIMRLARMAFSGRRKQLRNSIAAGLNQPKDTIAKMLTAEGISPDRRPQDLSLGEWAKIAKISANLSTNQV